MKNYSKAIFGSSLRKDFDKYSDKDLLIVADNYKTLNILKEKYSGEEWSISFYTYSKLDYLSKNGSLFIKHLQNECKILDDYQGKLNNIISNFVPKHDYKKDIRIAENYFKIITSIPDSTLGYAWYCDCLFVGLRNYLVFENAKNGIFEFSFNSLLNILKQQNKISTKDILILKELRVIKRNYREDIFEELPTIEYLNKVFPIINKLGLIESTEVLHPVIFQNKVEDKIISEKFNNYERLRLVEGFYCSQKINIKELKKIISNPQFYASKLKNDDFTLNLISEIKKQHTTKYKNNSRNSSKYEHCSSHKI